MTKRILASHVVMAASVILLSCGQHSTQLPKSAAGEQKTISSSLGGASLEPRARQLYDHALTIRQGRGDRGLNESMAIFRGIIREYPETSAAQDARRELRASEDLKSALDEVRRKLQRELNRP